MDLSESTVVAGIEKGSRQHVLNHIDRIFAQTYRADHLLNIRGVGQRRRYEKAMTHLQLAGEELRQAIAVLYLLSGMTED